jgi:hypothetical protein
VNLDDAVREGARAGTAAALADQRDELVEAVAARVVELIAPRLPPRFFSIPDAGRVLGGVSSATVKRQIRHGELKTFKLRGRTLVDLTAVRGVDEAEVAKLAAEVLERRPTPKKAEKGGTAR